MKRNTGRVYLCVAAALLLPLALLLQHAFAKEEKIAYITFDDGPTLNTPSIVQTLEKYNAKATFFVLEERIVLYPDFIKQIIHNGNAVGLHGVSHQSAIYATDTSVLEEMEKTNESLYNFTGKKSRLVRVPFGSSYRLTKNQAQHLSDSGFLIWDWTVDPRDSVGEIVAERVMENLRRGIASCPENPVILFHDRKSTAKLLPRVLEYLKNEGYEMRPISENLVPVNQIK